jgi:GNAT superfamily N-acetyltransferase
VDETAASAALRESKAAFARTLGTLPGATTRNGPDAGWVDTAVPDAVFNVAWSATPLLASVLNASVGAAVTHFRGRVLAFHWHLGLHDETESAAEVLVRRGLTIEDQEPGMWLELDTTAGDGPPDTGLAIRPVTDALGLREWMQVWGCGAPQASIERWYGVYAALPYGPDGRLRMLVGYLAGEPVACVYVFVTGELASVEYVVTVPEHRRRGMGAAMTWAAVGQARAAGCRIAVLTASDMGAGIYRRLGFRDCCTVTTYVWSPGTS